MDAAADAIAKYQQQYGPGDLSQEGADYIRNRVAPLYNAASKATKLVAPMFQGATLAAIYPEAVDKAAAAAGRIHPNLGGVVGAVGETAPYINPEFGAAKDAESAAAGAGKELLSKYGTSPVLPDGATERTLAREAAANQRRAAMGIPAPEVPPSDFSGRQAEHEGAVAQRNRQPAYVKAQIAATDVDPSLYPSNFSPPDNAQSIVAMDPQTGQHIGHITYVKRGDGVSSLRMDVAPEYRGQGIGSDLLGDAISNAHDMGLPYRSDTQVSVPAAKTYAKVPGAVRNDDVTHLQDPNDGDVGLSNNGRPVFEIPKQAAADDATTDEVPHFNPNSYVGSQAFAEGGEAAPLLSDIGSLVAKYGAPEAKPLAGLPTSVTIPGLGPTQVGPNPKIRQVADQYMQDAGINNQPQPAYVKADPVRGKAIAGAYEAAQHNPADPAVKASYDALIKETLAQYQYAKNAGLKVDFIPPGAPDPYAASPRLAVNDINDNNHMYVFPTSSGFGTEGAAPLDHPLLQDSGETISGQPATANDIFRVVHDYFGHAKEGLGFRADGEENAWNQHARMFSDQARPAMTAETRGQNSWVNFGPNGESNKTASGANTVYAPQKAVVLPDVYNQPDDQRMMHFLHMSNLSNPQVTLDPAAYGTGMKGAEARRGGIKTISLYPADIDPKDIELPLQNKTPYRVSVPASSMYDMSADSLGIRAAAPSYSDAEDALKDLGYAGYHTPDGEGIFRGQGRLFGPTQATQLPPITQAPKAAAAAKPSALYDDTLDTSDFAAGGAVGFAEGGEAALGLGDIGELVAKYATPDTDQATHLLNKVAQDGSATYNPTTGDVHAAGYAVPHELNRSVSFDSAPAPQDVHDFLLSNQDAFQNPKAAIHIESDDDGNHFMHVAHVEPDYEGAMAAAKSYGAPGVRELHTGVNFPVSDDPLGLQDSEHNPSVEDYLAGSKIPAADTPDPIDPDRNQRPQTAWKHGKPTVDPAQRVAFPGIYNDPRQTISDANQMVGPEDPLLQRLFGVSRQDLSDIALGRQGNEIGTLPGAKPGATGAASARAVMTPQNEQRLIDVLNEARGTPLHTGMTGWYSMDPLYERFRQIFGDEDAPAKYAKFNTLMGMASPGSDVATEIGRGTSAHWLDAQGRFPDFQKYAGVANDARSGIGDFPPDMLGVPGHAYHPTAQAGPMADYLRTGSIQMQSPKVPMYIGASGVPETGFQTDMPVGDAHWARGVGLADTRNPRTLKGQDIVPAASASTPEMQTLGPWWRDRVAAQAGYGAVPAQATAWGAFAPYTGVTSKIGAPKLEILATQIGKTADRLGVSPETARDLIIQGKAGAYGP
jgi:GNAT superfamily N-acetyltransferase